MASPRRSEPDQPLARLCGHPMEPGLFLRLAINIAKALGEMQRSTIHFAPTPNTIFVDTESMAVLLRDHPLPPDAEPDALAVPLPYLSPEQTGRIDREPDQRSAFYSLGVTFYYLLTGSLPFTADNPLDLVHSHLARAPRPPQQLVPGIPEILAALVLKLLAKNAEERYQSAQGLQADLERCLESWLKYRGIRPFTLGEGDQADRLLIPQKVYGREEEMALLTQAFGAAAESGPQLVVVTGSSGMGKTTLVRELHRPVIERGGFFLSGKGDLYRPEIPYRCITQAFGALINQILTGTEDDIQRWKRLLSEALGENAPLMLDVIPQLAFLIGPQPQAPHLPRGEEENRLALMLRRFVAVCATRAHPLVIFLDDLHSADAGTLKVLEQLVDPSNRHLLVIVAYRELEVDPGHPLTATLERIERQVAVQKIALPPLPAAEVLRFLSDTFRKTAPPLRPLAVLLRERTGGVPLFLKQMLTALYDRGLLRFDAARRLWDWDLEQIHGMPQQEATVMELVVAKLKKMQPEVLPLMQIASCIGDRFTAQTAAALTDIDEARWRDALRQAVAAGVLLPSGAEYYFLHDGVREALYQGIEEPRRLALHQELGRRLLTQCHRHQLDECLFEVVSQLNYGAAAIAQQEGLVQLAALNLRAARKARTSVAYDTALNYSRFGLRLLAAADRQAHRRLRFHLLLEMAQDLYLTGQLKRSAALLSLILPQSGSLLEKASVYRLIIDTAITAGEDDKAVEAALACLALFGIHIPERPTAAEVAVAYDEVWSALGTRSIAELVHLPRLADPEMEAALGILARLYAPAYHLDNNLFFMHLCQGVSLSLTHGSAPASVHFFGWFGVMLGSDRFNRPAEGYRFARTAYQLMEHHRFSAFRAEALFVLRIISYWTQPIDVMLQYSRSAFHAAVDTGDILIACFSSVHTCMGMIIAGEKLESVRREVAASLEFVRRTGFRDVQDILTTLTCFVEGMTGRSRRTNCFDEVQATFPPGRMPTLVFYHYVTKLMALYLSGRYQEALEAGEQARQYQWAGLFSSHSEVWTLYHGLTLAALYDTLPLQRQHEALATLQEHEARLKQWESSCPATFRHRRALLSAEAARCRGETEEAMQRYEEAIGCAREDRFLNDQALAFELAARFYRGRGLHTLADSCLTQSSTCYSALGAEGKVALLEEQNPSLVQKLAGMESACAVGRLDTVTVVSACQAISGETEFPDLLDTLMRMVLKNAGARRAYLLLNRAGDLLVEAEARVEAHGVEVLRQVWSPTPHGLPLTLINYVKRTRERVLLEDPEQEGLFSLDPYLVRERPESVLCLPILRQDTLLGLLYLENDLVKGAFTPERVVVLELLAAQTVISLENIRNGERFRALLESAPDAMVIVDDSGKIVMVNSQLQRVFGYDKEELQGQLVEVLIPERFRESHTKRRGGYTVHPNFRPMGERLELYGVRKDGSEFPVDISLSPLGTDQGLLVTAAIRDVSERKHAEDALRFSEARYRALHRDNPAMIFTLDADLGIISANPTAAAQLGHEIEELEGTSVLEMFLQQDRPAMEQSLRECLADPNTVRRWNVRKVRKDGNTIWVEGMGHAVNDLNGNLNILAVCQDITERKRAEDALQKSEQKYRLLTETLEERVKESVAELRQKDKILTIQGRQAVMGEMISNIAHQWRQPLNTLGLLAQELQITYRRGGLTGEAIESTTKRSMAIINHMSKTIDDFRNFFRPDKAKVHFRARDAVERALSLLEGTFKAAQITIELTRTADPVILGYPNEFSQAIINILINARDAFVARKVAHPVIHIELSEEGNKTVVAISDNAGGIPEDILDRIFDPYFTTKGPDKGTGVGLFMAKTIIEKNMGGTLRARNLEQGAQFRITVQH